MPRLKVMTLNLWGYRGDWSARRDRLLRCMQDEEVDVVLLQEVAERAWKLNQALEISQLTGYAASYVPAQRVLPWPPVGSGLAILSRFPITNPMAVEITPQSGFMAVGAGERRLAQRVELSLDGMSVVVYNTHFPLSNVERRMAAFRLWNQVMQEESVLVVVGGDFNARPAEECVLFLEGRTPMEGMCGALVDAWDTAGVGPEHTFPVDAPSARIDYVFYQAEPTVIVQETKVVGLLPDTMSDHAAVVATFSISPSRDQQLPFEEEPVGSLEPSGGGSSYGGGGFF